MKVNQAEFILSAMGPAQYPKDALPEIALAGRSNVGKSSLINTMLGRKAIARTSSKPGKTQSLNYYRVNNDLFFVDFPGYGFAKVSKSVKEKWGQLIEEYLTNRDELLSVLQIVDMRHEPTKDDIAMYEWLQHFEIPTIVVATKADKIPKGKWDKHIKIIKQGLNCSKDTVVIGFSSETGKGKDELWSEIDRRIKDFKIIRPYDEAPQEGS